MKNQYKLIENIKDEIGRGQKLSFKTESNLYLSPKMYECLMKKGLDIPSFKKTKCDVFSFGLCLLEAGL